MVFGAGQYSPVTGEGQRLLAHELTHVVQQGQAEEVRSSYMLDAITRHSLSIPLAVAHTDRKMKASQSEVNVQNVFTAPVLLRMENEQQSKLCGPNITNVIVQHLNDFVSQKQGNLNPIWFVGADTLQPFARSNAQKIRRKANEVTQCPIHSDCQGTYTIGGKCISGYHIDHILIMAYIEASYGVRTARSAGQYNESFWLGFITECAGFERSDNFISMADLTFNEVAICLAQRMRHAEENRGETDRLTDEEVQKCFTDAEMGVIGQKPAVGGAGGTYSSCAPCTVSADIPSDLLLPPIDL